VPADGNVRTVVSPAKIIEIITAPCAPEKEKSGFKLTKQTTLPTNPGLLDAYWEVTDTIHHKDTVLEEMRTLGVSEQEIAALRAGFDALQASVGGVEGGERGVRCMDAWAGVFEGA
jgi:hypothetical protein